MSGSCSRASGFNMGQDYEVFRSVFTQTALLISWHTKPEASCWWT